jgi:hypothetical protein
LRPITKIHISQWLGNSENQLPMKYLSKNKNLPVATFILVSMAATLIVVGKDLDFFQLKVKTLGSNLVNF